MVRTGARVAALQELLRQDGLRESAGKPAAPRLSKFPPDASAAIVDLYRQLGGSLEDPSLKPGSWDLAYEGGLLIELDEDFHFNRYRTVTLTAPFAANLPWADAYRRYSIDHENGGNGGKRWTNNSAKRLFGGADPAGVFENYGAPRWKQRALYDAMKDAAAAHGLATLARLSIHDPIGRVTLGDVLYGRAIAKPGSLRDLLESRIAQSGPC